MLLDVSYHKEYHHMGLDARKPVIEGLRTTKVQTSLHIHADCSVPLLFAFWKVSYLNLPQVKFQFSSLVPVAEETGLSLAFSETPDTFCGVKANIIYSDRIRSRGYKTFSCSTQLSTEFQLLIKTKIPTNEEFFLL